MSPPRSAITAHGWRICSDRAAFGIHLKVVQAFRLARQGGPDRLRQLRWSSVALGKEEGPHYCTALSVIFSPSSMIPNASRSSGSVTHNGGLVKNVFHRTNVYNP